MDSPLGTMNVSANTGTAQFVVPQTVEGSIAEDLEALIARVRERVSHTHTGQREWALARTNLEQAAHWVSEARGMNGGRGIAPGWYPEREQEQENGGMA